LKPGRRAARNDNEGATGLAITTPVDSIAKNLFTL